MEDSILDLGQLKNDVDDAASQALHAVETAFTQGTKRKPSEIVLEAAKALQVQKRMEKAINALEGIRWTTPKTQVQI